MAGVTQAWRMAGRGKHWQPQQAARVHWDACDCLTASLLD